MAAAAHIRVAEPSTFFAMPEGQRGIFVGGDALVNVVRLIGAARMMDRMLTERLLKAAEGEAIGLVQYLVGECGHFADATAQGWCAARAGLDHYRP